MAAKSGRDTQLLENQRPYIGDHAVVSQQQLAELASRREILIFEHKHFLPAWPRVKPIPYLLFDRRRQRFAGGEETRDISEPMQHVGGVRWSDRTRENIAGEDIDRIGKNPGSANGDEPRRFPPPR